MPYLAEICLILGMTCLWSHAKVEGETKARNRLLDAPGDLSAPDYHCITKDPLS